MNQIVPLYIVTHVLVIEACTGLFIALHGEDDVEFERDVPAPSKGVPSNNLTESSNIYDLTCDFPDQRRTV